MKYRVVITGQAYMIQDVTVDAENEGLAEQKAKETVNEREWKYLGIEDASVVATATVPPYFQRGN